MNETPKLIDKIAFLVVSMNHEKFVHDFIESVKNQTFTNVKVYWIDNCSKDNTFSEAKKQLIKFDIEHEIYSNSVSKKVTENFNLALSKIQDENYVSIISADDMLLPENFEQKIAYLKTHEDTPVVYSNGYNYFAPNNKQLISDTMVLKGGEIYNDLLKNSFVIPVGALFKATVFTEVGVFDETIGIEDWDFFLRVAKNNPIGYIDAPLYYYRQHNENMSTNVGVSYLDDCFKTLKKHKRNKNHLDGVDWLMPAYVHALLADKKNIFISLFKIIIISGVRKKTIFYIKNRIRNGFSRKVGVSQ